MTYSLNQQIATFYDHSSRLWETIWGEHMHHGYYGRNGSYKMNRRQAQIDLIEELLSYAQVKEVKHILDIGCGVGGSTLYLGQKFKAKGTGITLSSVQVARAKERAIQADLSEQIQFLGANALEMPFADNVYDLVWSLESAEHIPDKRKFLQECYRVLEPQGTFIMATWCHRPTTSLAGELTHREQKQLEKISQIYALPSWVALPEYQDIATQCGFQNIKVDDWSMAVAPFWDEVINAAISPQAIFGLLTSGWRTIEAALAMPLMRQGYESGLIRFAVLSAQK